jgi:hypothetical protein
MIAIDALSGILRENDTVVCFKEITTMNCKKLDSGNNISLPRPGQSYTISSIGTDRFQNHVQINGFYAWFPADDFYKKYHLPTEVNENAYKMHACLIG